jgi:hypothetical protein
MRNDAETIDDTDATEIAAPKVNWRYTALGYVFVLAMGAMAVWVTPSADPASVQPSVANPAIAFIPFGGGTGRVVLGQAEQSQASDETGRSAQMRPPAAEKYSELDQMPAPKLASTAITAHD